MSDKDLFESMLGDDVERIQVEKREKLSSSKDEGVDKTRRRSAAEEMEVSSEDPLASDPIEMVDPMGELSYRRPGVQHGVFKNLRLGKYTIDARLDLHRLTKEQARKAVYQFVSDCIENDVRCALITHGKGEHREQPALLKSCVAHWLPQLEEILAFHTAQKQHGSYGATYVLIRKSDSKKLENREKNRRKS